ncbi:MAG: FkbM family methyltransferase [Planctomycetota bacterium]
MEGSSDDLARILAGLALGVGAVNVALLIAWRRSLRRRIRRVAAQTTRGGVPIAVAQAPKASGAGAADDLSEGAGNGIIWRRWMGKRLVLPQYYPPFARDQEATRRDYSIAASARFPGKHAEFRSQYGEDAFLFDLFEGKGDGVYVEAGAFDGQTLSVTSALEEIGWNGLLVEPTPLLAKACRDARPRSIIVEAALTSPGGPAEIEFCQVTGFEHSGLYSFVYTEGEEPPPPPVPGASKEFIRVAASTLDRILATHPIQIDAFVLDVEGHELPALAGLDLGKTRPKVIVVEVSAVKSVDELTEYLQARGYVVAGVLGVSVVMVATECRELLKRATRLLAAAKPVHTGV